MIRLRAIVRLDGDLRTPDGKRVPRVLAGAEFLADEDNAKRLIRHGRAERVEPPKPKKAEPKEG